MNALVRALDLAIDENRDGKDDALPRLCIVMVANYTMEKLSDIQFADIDHEVWNYDGGGPCGGLFCFLVGWSGFADGEDTGVIGSATDGRARGFLQRRRLSVGLFLGSHRCRRRPVRTKHVYMVGRYSINAKVEINSWCTWNCPG